MGKLTKNRKLSEAKVDNTKLYNLDEACSLLKMKPTSSKGTYIKSIYISSTMSPSLAIDPKI